MQVARCNEFGGGGGVAIRRPNGVKGRCGGGYPWNSWRRGKERNGDSGKVVDRIKKRCKIEKEEPCMSKRAGKKRKHVHLAYSKIKGEFVRLPAKKSWRKGKRQII